MIKTLFRGLGGLALLLASAAFLAAVSLLVLGSFLLTYPVLRQSPRQRKLQATVELASAGLALLSTFANHD